jgi:hypothetical protein
MQKGTLTLIQPKTLRVSKVLISLVTKAKLQPLFSLVKPGRTLRNNIAFRKKARNVSREHV